VYRVGYIGCGGGGGGGGCIEVGDGMIVDDQWKVGGRKGSGGGERETE
jgi:hypothetical protein